MMRTRGLFLGLMTIALAALPGCQNETPVSEQAETDSLQLPANLAISEKPLNEALTGDEVTCFLELVQSFPEGKVPELAPVPGHNASDTDSPEEMAQAARRSIRESLTADTLIQGWSPTTSVRRAIRDENIEPRAVVSLMLRLSCAVAADAIGTPREIRAQRVIADQKVDEIIDQIHRLRQAGRNGSEALLQSLHESASMAEYLAILAEIPVESQQLVAEHRADLQAILPANSQDGKLRETREDSQISPVNFESIDDPRSRRRQR